MLIVPTYVDEEDINNRDTIIGCHVFGWLIDKWFYTEFHYPHLECSHERPLSWMIPQNLTRHHL